MPCFNPLNAYHVPGPGKSKKISFLKSGDSIPTNGEYLRLPCGQCAGCRLDRSRHWATRCMHEARQHADNCFITLTYADTHLPWDGSLNLRHWQEFMKRLRGHAQRKFGIGDIKFFHAGEYGENGTKRPHYHACIFGFDFLDKKPWKRESDYTIYTSDALDTLWGKGFTTVGDLNWSSAAYCARYNMKKINGPRKEQIDPKTGLRPYDRVHAQTGEVIEVRPEYCTMSRRPGIGHSFITDYIDDIFPWDECIVNGHPTRPPRYYDNFYAELDAEGMEEIKERRIEVMHKYAPDNTRARLRERAKVKDAQLSTLKRNLE